MAANHLAPYFPNQKEIKSLYDVNYERDACGVGFIVNINGQASNKVNNLRPTYLDPNGY